MAQVISSEEFNNLVEHIEGIAVVDFLQLGVDHVKC